ncbi:MAG: hypothetical protein KL787_06805 [Taibaiella sp.]|nr:hypothetical protein [Taibaiella sp.]
MKTEELITLLELNRQYSGKVKLNIAINDREQSNRLVLAQDNSGSGILINDEVIQALHRLEHLDFHINYKQV